MKTEKKEGVINAENGTVPVLRISIPVKVLLDVEDEALEIFAFGMINVYGVIGRLMELMEEARAIVVRACDPEQLIFGNGADPSAKLIRLQL